MYCVYHRPSSTYKYHPPHYEHWMGEIRVFQQIPETIGKYTMTRLTCMTLPARINPFYSTIPTQQTKQKCVYGGEGGFLQSANRALKLVQPVLIFLLAFLG